MIRFEPNYTDPSDFNFICSNESEKDFIDKNIKSLIDKFIRLNSKWKNFEEYYSELTAPLEFGEISFKSRMYDSRNLEFTKSTINKFESLINYEFDEAMKKKAMMELVK